MPLPWRKRRFHTYYFVLLAVSDGSAKQTLYLVGGVIWVFTLPLDNRNNYPLWEKNRRTKQIQSNQNRTDCPGEALVLGNICDVERLHCVFNVLSVHVVNLANVTVPEEKHKNRNN